MNLVSGLFDKRRQRATVISGGSDGCVREPEV
jgi:hypothetical protein